MACPLIHDPDNPDTVERVIRESSDLGAIIGGTTLGSIV
jgi:hypothetical protein